MTGYLIQAFIYLIAAIIMVPLAKRFGLGSVLGYLIAGVIIGPAIGLVGEETATIQHFAEFGVVMMLFLVGLELDPRMLWSMRNKLLGLGGLQVALTVSAITGIAIWLGQPWQIAVTIGLIFSLSSTAIVLQTFNEKGLAKTEGGRSAFSVLLFQDIAVIPMLALIPLLALPELLEASQVFGVGGDHHDDISLVSHLSGWAYALVVAGAIAFVIIGGHFLSHPLFKYVASSGLREVFTATALTLIIGIAALMSLVGLSPALGAFLAGVVLANSEFRHELESNIEPFKGLLLGLFFITVGAGINFSLLADNILTIMGLTLAVMLIKATVLFILAFVFRIKSSDRWLFTLSLAQAGEFGFVLLGFASQNSVLPQEISQILALVVALSMFLTPGLFILFDKVILPRFEEESNDREVDEIDEQAPVIVAGMGRFGQIINRLLVANGINTVALDHEVSQIDNIRKFNIKSFYGDASQSDLLHTAGIEKARCLIIAIDDRVRAINMVEHVKRHYPDTKILARAFDRGHAYKLRRAGADTIISETYFSALELGGKALTELGFHPFHAEQAKAAFLKTEENHQDSLYETWSQITDDVSFSSQYSKLFIRLEETIGDAMRKDRTDNHSRIERVWTPPPKGYTKELDQPEQP